MVTESLKEENKHLQISLWTNLFATVVVLTGGLVGLFISEINTIYKLIFIPPSIYLDFLLIINLIDVNKIILNNIGAMKNERWWNLSNNIRTYDMDNDILFSIQN